VLTDRYIYSLMARAIVRGVDPAWIRSLFSVALKPDAVFYLRIGIDQLIPRVIFSRGFDYWESGMDVYPGHDMYESFRTYQTALLHEFDRLGAEFDFEIVDASAEAKVVFEQLQSKILGVLEHDSRKTYLSGVPEYGGVSLSRPEPAKATRRDPWEDLDRLVHQVAAHRPAGNGNGAAHHK
jgi:hypothetical protein